MAWWSKASREKRKSAKEQQKLDRLEEKERKRQFKELSKEADYWAQKLTKACAQQGMMHILRGVLEPGLFDVMFSGARPVQQVKFTHHLFDKNQIWFRVDTLRLPYRVQVTDFKEPEFLETVGYALGKKVFFKGNEKAGAFLVLERDGSVAGIPKYVSMQSAYKLLPATVDPLTIIIGMAEYGELAAYSLKELQHLLVAGSTGSGKSIWLNQTICTLAARNTPDQLKMLLIDLKNGNEFGLYRKLPHLWKDKDRHVNGIVNSVAEVSDALYAVISLIDERGKLFSKADVRNIDEFNARNKDKLPYFLVVVDELSRLLHNADKDLRKMAKFLLNDVMATARAYGVHVILCTQEPSSKIVPTYIKTNAPARVCFRVPSIGASMTVVGDKSAYKLSPRGRGVFQYDEQFEFQGPMISTSQVKKHVLRIIGRGGATETTAPVVFTLYDLLEYALTNLEGKLTRRALVAHFQPKGLSEFRINELLNQAEGERFQINGASYEVINLGNKGRKMVPIVEESLEDLAPAVASD